MMKDMGIVQGSPEMAIPLLVGKDTVYVHTDIHEVPDAEGNMVWKYHELQYDKDEYIRFMDEKNTVIEQQLSDTQLALVEVYEMLLL